MKIMKSISFKIKLFFILILFIAGIVNSAFSQVPASLEKELVEFNSAIYDALKIINTENEKKAVQKLAVVKPQLIQKAKTLSGKLSKQPDLSEAEENALMNKMKEKQVLKDMMALMSNPTFLQKIEKSQLLQKEYEELMAIMDMGTSSKEESASLSGSQVCSFNVGTGSPNSGNYVVTANEDVAFAYNDVENEQFVIEIRGDNYIDLMLIIEKPVKGKHPFTMEMQVSINISINDGEDYFSFENHQEEGGGYIQIDRIDDKSGGKVTGSFNGLFSDSSRGDEKPVSVKGKFSVKRM